MAAGFKLGPPGRSGPLKPRPPRDRAAPRLDLPVTLMPLGFGAPSFQAGQDLVMRIVCGQVQAQIESRRAQQPKQSRQRGLPLITLVRRNHGDWNSSPLSQFPLAHAGLQPGQLQQRRRRRRQPFNVIRLAHNTIVLCGGRSGAYCPAAEDVPVSQACRGDRRLALLIFGGWSNTNSTGRIACQSGAVMGANVRRHDVVPCRGVPLTWVIVTGRRPASPDDCARWLAHRLPPSCLGTGSCLFEQNFEFRKRDQGAPVPSDRAGEDR